MPVPCRNQAAVGGPDAAVLQGLADGDRVAAVVNRAAGVHVGAGQSGHKSATGSAGPERAAVEIEDAADRTARFACPATRVPPVRFNVLPLPVYQPICTRAPSSRPNR